MAGTSTDELAALDIDCQAGEELVCHPSRVGVKFPKFQGKGLPVCGLTAMVTLVCTHWPPVIGGTWLYGRSSTLTVPSGQQLSIGKRGKVVGHSRHDGRSGVFQQVIAQTCRALAG
jgi:hypothetical protein